MKTYQWFWLAVFCGFSHLAHSAVPAAQQFDAELHTLIEKSRTQTKECQKFFEEARSRRLLVLERDVYANKETTVDALNFVERYPGPNASAFSVLSHLSKKVPDGVDLDRTLNRLERLELCSPVDFFVMLKPIPQSLRSHDFSATERKKHAGTVKLVLHRALAQPMTFTMLAAYLSIVEKLQSEGLVSLSTAQANALQKISKDFDSFMKLLQKRASAKKRTRARVSDLVEEYRKVDALRIRLARWLN